MKQPVYRFTVLPAILAALALSGPATAGESVPFKGQSSGVITTVGFDPVKGVVYTHIGDPDGEGEATHLGHFKVTGDAAIDLATGIVTGTYTHTAADGDRLFLRLVASGIDPTHGTGTITIVGGTGRFEGATGSFKQHITFVFPPGSGFPPSQVSYTEVLEGTISFGH